ncbi:hypothetical protein ACFX1W_029289 [Malus domestica]
MSVLFHFFHLHRESAKSAKIQQPKAFPEKTQKHKDPNLKHSSQAHREDKGRCFFFFFWVLGSYSGHHLSNQQHFLHYLAGRRPIRRRPSTDPSETLKGFCRDILLRHISLVIGHISYPPRTGGVAKNNARTTRSPPPIPASFNQFRDEVVFSA